MTLQGKRVEIYTRPSCPACTLTKNVLRDAGVPFIESVRDEDHTLEMLKDKFPTATTYPVIVVDGFYIGGYTQLNEALHDSKRLLTEGEWNGA